MTNLDEAGRTIAAELARHGLDLSAIEVRHGAAEGVPAADGRGRWLARGGTADMPRGGLLDPQRAGDHRREAPQGVQPARGRWHARRRVDAGHGARPRRALAARHADPRGRTAARAAARDASPRPTPSSTGRTSASTRSSTSTRRRAPGGRTPSATSSTSSRWSRCSRSLGYR